MKTSEALKIIGGSLSKPSKMPGWSIGLPAKECKTGGKLQAVKGSVCYDCYALKGCYVFKVVQDAQYRRLAAIKSPLWVAAMAHLINSKKPDEFRWHDSGDVQDEEHLLKIYAVCRLTPSKRHWMPTREAWIKHFLKDKPDNLVIRFSAPMVNQRAPESWPNSSEVVDKDFNCPASLQDNECKDCRKCWDPEIKTIRYHKH
jgi:hypothetical protein|tara:strand:- start:123 stop:725 length:603 start_codon:yes stop_codon:yes gene_type:complete